jgi:hypothetical protein
MRCFECERESVGLCRWCMRGHCEVHFSQSLAERDRIPAMGCIHQFRELAEDPPAASGR